MRIFQLKNVARFTRNEGIKDASLSEAVDRAARGLIDADLGGGLIKQRVARQGQGRRGGYRMLIGLRAGDRAIFLFGFAKNVLGNIDDKVLAELRLLGTSYLNADAATLEENLRNGTIIEVQHGKKN